MKEKKLKPTHWRNQNCFLGYRLSLEEGSSGLGVSTHWWISRGMSVLLLEKALLPRGYLQAEAPISPMDEFATWHQGDVGPSIRGIERRLGRLLRNCSSFGACQPFIIRFKHLFDRIQLPRFAWKMYDDGRSATIGKSKWISKEETHPNASHCFNKDWMGGVVYHDPGQLIDAHWLSAIAQTGR